MPLPRLDLQTDGAAHCARAAKPVLGILESALAGVAGGPGARLHDIPDLAAPLAADGLIGQVAAARLGGGAQAVRAILFDKNPGANWALGWHQDRTIAVRERREVPGFGPWTVKQGLVHVAPPFALLAGMLTLRVHIDAVPADNAPLLIAPGSHRALVPEAAIPALVHACGTVACLAEVGDVWVYATPILHASARAQGSMRRVLQVDYAAGALPGGLEWLGV